VAGVVGADIAAEFDAARGRAFAAALSPTPIVGAFAVGGIYRDGGPAGRLRALGRRLLSAPGRE